MNWRREVIEDSNKSLTIILLIILSLISIFTQSYFGLGVFAFCLIYFWLHKKYMEQIGNGVRLEQSSRRVRIHCDEKGHWDFYLENQGLPIWGATIELSFKGIVEPISHPFDTLTGDLIEVSIPFSIGKGEEVKISLPILGKKRGLCRLSNVKVIIPHLFGSGKVLLELMEPVKSTIIVFPPASPIKLTSDHHTNRNGEVSTAHSLFYDVFQPIGTREYVSGDRFQDIHWKATARTQQLQTKVFAPATKKEWMIAINLSDRYSITAQLESIIQHTAYLLYLAVEQNISFSLVINARSLGVTPFYYLPSGIGRKHQQRALELLAALSTDEFTVPFHIVLQHLSIHQLIPSVLLVGGVVTPKDEKRLRKIETGIQNIYRLNSDDKQGVVTLWNQTLKIPS